jgi:transposase
MAPDFSLSNVVVRVVAIGNSRAVAMWSRRASSPAASARAIDSDASAPDQARERRAPARRRAESRSLHDVGFALRNVGEPRRVRSRLIGQRTAVINQIRGFLLEHGIAVRQGLRFLRQQLPDILAKRSDVLSPRMIRIMEDLSGDWRLADERIQHVTEEIEVLAHSSESCRQLMSVPGIGPIIASAMVAAIGNGAALPRAVTLPPGSA